MIPSNRKRESGFAFCGRILNSEGGIFFILMKKKRSTGRFHGGNRETRLGNFIGLIQ